MMALDSMNLSITEVDVNMDKGEHRGPEIAAVSSLISHLYSFIIFLFLEFVPQIFHLTLKCVYCI